MQKFIAAIAAAVVLASVPATAKPADPDAALAKLLEGRVAGKPESCISLRNIRSTQIINRTAIVYDVGRVRYVNRPDAGAESLDNWKVLVTDTHSSQLCNIDIVRLYDSGARSVTGFVNLGDFVPYRKADAAGRD